MTSLQILDSDLPDLTGKIAIVTGGSSGIGLSTVHLLASKNARVHVLDLQPPLDPLPPNATYTPCDTTSWSDLNTAFTTAGGVDIAIANAGIGGPADFNTDNWSADGLTLREPRWDVLDINLRGAVAVTKLAAAWMRRQARGGSIVLTASSIGYAPEWKLPLYAATKGGLLNFMRSMRIALPVWDIGISCVCPGWTRTPLVAGAVVERFESAGTPVGGPEAVARAIVFSATAMQDGAVELYGRDEPGSGRGRWNGRAILVLGDGYTEIEGQRSALKEEWFGVENTRMTKMQQALTDTRWS